MWNIVVVLNISKQPLSPLSEVSFPREVKAAYLFVWLVWVISGNVCQGSD